MQCDFDGECQPKVIPLPMGQDWGIHTPCRDCVFAEYEGSTQVGCYLDMLDKMRNNGAEIVPVRDNEKEFFVVKGRACMPCRSPAWARAQDAKSLDELGDLARSEFTLKCDTFILIEANNSFEDVVRTVESLKKQKVKPRRLILMNFNLDIKPVAVRQLLKAEPYIKWNLEQVVEDVSDGQRLPRLVNIAARKAESPYYCAFVAGFEVPEDYLSSIDKALNTDMQRLMLLVPEEEQVNGVFMQRMTHKLIGGFSHDESLYEKVKAITESQECQYLVKPLVEIVPSMSQQSQ